MDSFGRDIAGGIAGGIAAWFVIVLLLGTLVGACSVTVAPWLYSRISVDVAWDAEEPSR